MLHSKLNVEEKDMVYELVDLAMEKVTKYRDIIPQASTLQKLRNGKVRKTKRGAKHLGEARVLTHEYVNQALQKVRNDKAEQLRRQQAIEERKRAAEVKKNLREQALSEWKAKLDWYNEFEVPIWQSECSKIDTKWIAAKQLGQRGKKPPHPPRPQRPRKPQFDSLSGGSELSTMIEEGVGVGDDVRESGEEDESQNVDNNGNIVDSMQKLNFGDVCTLILPLPHFGLLFLYSYTNST